MAAPRNVTLETSAAQEELSLGSRKLSTWRIIPGLGSVVNNHRDVKSPFSRVVGPLPNGINDIYEPLANWNDPPSRWWFQGVLSFLLYLGKCSIGLKPPPSSVCAFCLWGHVGC